MKNIGIWVVAISLMVGIWAFTWARRGEIRGSVTPKGAAESVVTVAGTDTVRAEYKDGFFSLKGLSNGTYSVWIKAASPYRDTVISHVVVSDTLIADIGDIRLTP